MNAMAVIPELNEPELGEPELRQQTDEAEVATAAGESERIEALLRQHIDITKPYAVQRDVILEAFRKAYVALLLAHTNGNRSHAARIAQVERSHFTKLANRLGGRRER